MVISVVMKKILLAVLVATILISGCINQKDSDTAAAACVARCEDALNAGENLSNGPCLSNEIIKNWVCDVAHSPRQAVDNLLENQCSAYGVTASHFVEVDTNCSVIRTV